MKRIRLFFLLIAFLAFQPTGFAQQLIQGFEGNYFPPAAWEVRTTIGTGWVNSITFPHTGSRSAFVNFDVISVENINEEVDSWLISPKIQNINSADNLSFYLKPQFADIMDPGAGYFDSLLIYVSTTTNDSSAFTLFKGIAISGIETVYAQYEYSLAAYEGQNIYIAFRNHQMAGSGFYLDDVTAGTPLLNDIGSSSINLSNNAIIASGTPINIVDTIKNFGTNSLPSGIPVSYSVNDGPKVTLATATGLASGETATISFTGSNAFVPATTGKYVIKVFTDYSADANRANDTIKYLLTVQNAVNSYPYFTDFDSDPEWTLAGEKNWQKRTRLNIPNKSELTNPVGVQDTAMLALTFGTYGDFILRSPLLNFTSVTKPMINFYVAASSASVNANDVLEVVVSTDGGLSYHSTPLYQKSNTTNPKLSTVPNQFDLLFVPQETSEWRHEIVDLSAYAGMKNVMVCFKVIADNSNTVWIDNVTFVDQPVAFYHAEKVTSASQIVTGAFNTKVIFHSLPSADSIRMQGHNSEPPHILNGDDRFASNSSATTQDGTIKTPNFVFDRFVTIAFSGNSISRANYDVSMDISGLNGIEDPNKLYILKRADMSGKWVALSTTRSGNILTATGLNNFSDFAIGYYSIAVPVNLVSFTGYLDNNNTSVLNWKTAQEINISDYEVQRMRGNSWFTLGTVASNGGALSNSYSFADYAPEVGVNYYRLKINSVDGSSSYSEIVKVELNPSGNKVYQNVPNPFKNYTIIRYDLSRKANVKIVVYNVSGSEVAVLESGQKQAGSYQAKWLTGNVPAGNYFYKVIIDDQVITKSMLKVQ